MLTFAGLAVVGSVVFLVAGVVVLFLIARFARRSEETFESDDAIGADLGEIGVTLGATPRSRVVPPAYKIVIACFGVAAVLGVLSAAQRPFGSTGRLLERIETLEQRLAAAEIELETHAVATAVRAAIDGRSATTNEGQSQRQRAIRAVPSADPDEPSRGDAPAGLSSPDKSAPSSADAPAALTRGAPPASTAGTPAGPGAVPPPSKGKALPRNSAVVTKPAPVRVGRAPETARRAARSVESPSRVAAAPPASAAPASPVDDRPSRADGIAPVPPASPAALSGPLSPEPQPPVVSAPGASGVAMPAVAATPPSAERDAARTQALSESPQSPIAEKLRSDWEAIKRAGREGGNEWVDGWRRLRGMFGG